MQISIHELNRRLNASTGPRSRERGISRRAALLSAQVIASTGLPALDGSCNPFGLVA